MTPNNETTISCLTPDGRGAIATLALLGPQAWNVVRREFRGRRLPEAPQPHSVWYGKIGGDDVVVGVIDEHIQHIEIHCHGGLEVVAYLKEIFQKHDAIPCDWQQFVQNRTRALRAPAQSQLAKATTLRTASILLDQYNGAFAIATADVIGLLQNNRVDEAETNLAQIAQFENVGRHLIDPWKIVIAGAPNVGKSSLVNAITGYQRTIVSPIAGTTRDVVSTAIALDGWPVEVFDTAGWRRHAETLEQQGIDKADAVMKTADLCLWVVDGSTQPDWPEEGENLRYVVNKIDLPPAWDYLQRDDIVRVSAKSGEGVADLCQAIADILVPNPPPDNAAVPFTADLCDRVARAQTALRGKDVAAATEELRPLAD